MIKSLNLLHYPSQQTYKAVCGQLGLNAADRQIKGNHAFYPGEPICLVHPYNIIYDSFGHVWFLSVSIDFQKLMQGKENFETKLFSEYTKLFGENVMNGFPAIDDIYCKYIEYENTVTVQDADSVIKDMAASGCPPEQLDENKWTEYKKPRGTIEFCVSKIDDTHLKTLARCHGTALQKRIKDKSLCQMGAGVRVAKMVEEQTETDIINGLYSKHKIPVGNNT